ncbi:hypothetical protein CEE35_05435 [Candidatus Aerophobetes bacterium Ae_b3b]|nr:MAG: hypothetical protein CEE35_05435 [Candidatus Aerophobetes bacterium Ae_b3b]
MFPRISETRSKGKLYRYVKIVENYWHKGQSRQRVVAKLGNLEKFKNTDLEKLIKGLCRICEREDLNVENLKAKKSPR